MIVGFRAMQDQGKTSLAVKTVRWLLNYGGYEPQEVISTVRILIPGTVFVNGKTMIKCLKLMVDKDLRHKIFLLDEVDRILPARYWNDKEQTDAVLGLAQDIKMFNWFLWTAHLGPGTDINLRNSTQCMVIPKYIKKRDMTTAFIIDQVNMMVAQANFRDISKEFQFYDRWARVKMDGSDIA